MRWIFFALSLSLVALAGERQLTTSAHHHVLDNNDNFSPDDRFLCFDTRGSGQAIGKVDTRTGAESVVYSAGPTVIAASFHPRADEVVFIHGPFDQPYAKTNRLGASVGPSGSVRFLDTRDVVSPVTPPGAHRGGTHRHEYSLDGKRIGFTYDDHLLPQYGRTIGMLVPHSSAPGGRLWFTILVGVVPEGDARPGDIVMAAGDSWVGEDGRMRAFAGRVKDSGGSFRNSLFVVDIPASVDVTTAFAGDASRFPSPPRGLRVRRLTQSDIFGIARGSRDGRWIAYLAAATDGSRQVFVIPSAGGQPRQITHAEGGVEGGVRWHPAGRHVAVSTRRGILVSNVQTGAGKLVASAGGDGLVWSNDGRSLAYNRKVGAYQQIFLTAVDPDMLP
jgi:hypothetical protein